MKNYSAVADFDICLRRAHVDPENRNGTKVLRDGLGAILERRQLRKDPPSEFPQPSDIETR